MKRRNFLKNISKLSSTPLLLNGIGLHAFASPALLQFLTTCTGVEERTIVILFLKGGNDGLNTILPIDQYADYINFRPNIGLPETGTGAYINLDTTLDVVDQVGIHPSMTNFKDMYDSGQARFIQAVGYPSFNRSHFKSSDLWLGGGDGTPGGTQTSGWVGRFFENAYPGVHNNPNNNFPDPLGIQFGDRKASLAFHDCSSTYEGINLFGQDPGNLFGLLNGLGTEPHATTTASEFGSEINYIMDVENSTNAYGQRITEVYNAGTNSSVIYPDSELGNQFATIARLLAGGSQTKMFMAHKRGFDTHAGQVVSGNSSIGTHANLLSDVFDSIKAFHNDLTNLGLGQKVVTLAFSEFSRRITENGSLGSDHGNYGPVFVFGDAVNPGITGTNFNLTAINSSGNMDSSEMQYDYRDIFKTLLQDWMGAGDDILDPALMLPYTIIPDLIKEDQTVDPSCYISPDNILPVELNYFAAKLTSDEKVELEWATATEVNSDYFEIERMGEDEKTEIISSVMAQGSSDFEQSYTEIDPNPLLGKSYYRLRSVDRDDQETLSDWKAIELTSNGVKDLKIYPNPAVYGFHLVLTADERKEGSLDIITANGQKVFTKNITIKSGFNKFSVAVTDFPVGQYFVHLSGEGLDFTPMSLLVQRNE